MRPFQFTLVLVVFPWASIAAGTGRDQDQLSKPAPQFRLGTPAFRHLADVTAIAICTNGSLVSAGNDGCIRFWDPNSGALQRTISTPDVKLSCLALSTNNERLAFTGESGTVTVLETRTGKTTLSFRGPPEKLRAVSTIAISGDSKRMAACSDSRVVTIWDLDTGKEIKTISTNYRFTKATFDSNLENIVAADVNGKIHRLHLSTGQDKIIAEYPDACHAIRMCQGRAFLAGNGDLLILDLATKDSARWLRSVKNATSIATSASGDFVAVSFDAPNPKLALLDASNGNVIWKTQLFETAKSLEFSPDGKTVAVTDQQSFRLFCVKPKNDSERESSIGSLGHRSGVVAISSDRKNNRLASVDRRGICIIWDLKTQGLLHSFHFSAPPTTILLQGQQCFAACCDQWLAKDIRTGETLTKINEPQLASSLGITPNGCTGAGAIDDRLRLHTPLFGGQESVFRPGFRIQCCAISPQGHMLAVASKDNARITVWDLNSKKQLWAFQLQGTEEARCWSLAFSPIAPFLACGTSDKAIAIFDLLTGKQLTSITTNETYPYQLVFSPDGLDLGFLNKTKACVAEFFGGKLAIELDGPYSTLTFLDSRELFALGRQDTVVEVFPLYRLRDTDTPSAKLLESILNQGAHPARQAIAHLSSRGDQAVEILERKLLPPTKTSPARLARLLEALDSESFSIREQATKDLGGLGRSAIPALIDHQPLASAEARMRINRVLETQLPLPPQSLGLLRMQKTLALIGTPRAKKVLRSLLAGDAAAIHTTLAKHLLAEAR